MDSSELEQNKKLLDEYQEEISELEAVNIDLERQLELQAKISLAIEKECLSSQRDWSARCKGLQNDIKRWKAECEARSAKGVALKRELENAQQELKTFYQRRRKVGNESQRTQVLKVTESNQDEDTTLQQVAPAINTFFFLLLFFLTKKINKKSSK